MEPEEVLDKADLLKSLFDDNPGEVFDKGEAAERLEERTGVSFDPRSVFRFCDKLVKNYDRYGSVKVGKKKWFGCVEAVEKLRGGNDV